ncbi:MAG: cytochrome c [Flavobacterium sp.]|nr:cytochrome c [Flavobacterium sp.]
MKRIRQVLTISISLLILFVGIILYQIITYKTPSSDFYCATPVPLFCGTPNLSENQEKGKEIFNSNCAACHKLDAKSTGPALRGVDSLVFVKWIIRKNHKIDTTNIEKLGLDYHRTMFIEYVKEKDLGLIIEYCSRERDY